MAVHGGGLRRRAGRPSRRPRPRVPIRASAARSRLDPRLRALSRQPDMRVLFMSGYTDDSIVRHGVLESNIAYLQKPITPAMLTTKVREVLDATNGRTA